MTSHPAALLVLLLVLASCGPALPQKEVDTALAAYSAAKAALADVFAPEAFQAASEANAQLQANLAQHDYANTLPLALVLTTASKAAQNAAAAGVEAARVEVVRLAAEVPLLAVLVRAELEKARLAGRRFKLDPAPLHQELAAAEEALAGAQVAVEAGNLAEARAKLLAVQATYLDLQQRLEGAGIRG